MRPTSAHHHAWPASSAAPHHRGRGPAPSAARSAHPVPDRHPTPRAASPPPPLTGSGNARPPFSARPLTAAPPHPLGHRVPGTRQHTRDVVVDRRRDQHLRARGHESARRSRRRASSSANTSSRTRTGSLPSARSRPTRPAVAPGRTTTIPRGSHTPSPASRGVSGPGRHGAVRPGSPRARAPAGGPERVPPAPGRTTPHGCSRAPVARFPTELRYSSATGPPPGATCSYALSASGCSVAIRSRRWASNSAPTRARCWSHTSSVDRSIDRPRACGPSPRTSAGCCAASARARSRTGHPPCAANAP